MPEEPLENLNEEDLNKWLSEWPGDSEAATAGPASPHAEAARSHAAGHTEQPQPEPFVPVPFEPPSPDETMRRSGLAYSAGIVFFGAIAFMLFIGWIFDLVFGTKPWGLVGGIVVGSIIGFIQFFRISSQIFNPEESEHEMHPLLSHKDDDE